MNILSNQNIKSIEQIFQLKQSSLLRVMKQFLKTKYNKVVCTNDYLIAIGDIPVALIAHLDTVFKDPPQRIFYDRIKNVMWSPEGLGADDRAGIFSIVQIVKSGLRPTIILTTDEERGCLGAGKLIKDIPNPPTELKYIIELDRRGSDDCVFYQCENAEFENYVERFGFVMNFGSFSDISVICPAWKIAGVNLSIGYYDEHSYSETLYVGQMLNTINKVKNMLIDADSSPYFEYKEKSFNWETPYGVSKEFFTSLMQTQSECVDCNQWDFDYNLFPVKDIDKTTFFCCDCISKRQDIHWCRTCGEPFIDSNLKKGSIYQCKDCRG